MKEKLSTLIAIFSLISIVFGGYFYIDSRYALAESVEYRDLQEKKLQLMETLKGLEKK